MIPPGEPTTTRVLDRAFEPFFTTKEIGKGTGLGLSMVFGVVRQSGGTVRIGSRVREGTTVQIYLPRANEPVASSVDRVRTTGTAKGAHILVVDDDPDVRWVITQDLQQMGCVVTEAESGRAALTMLERETRYDLVIIDLVMPGLSGLETLRLARRSRPELRVLFTSGYADLSRFGDNLRDHPLLQKPFTLEGLAEMVQTVLQGVSSDKPDNVVPLRRDLL